MNEGLIPRRYAKALFKVSEEKGDSGEVYKLMSRLAQSFGTVAGLNRAVSNPFVSDADKYRLVVSAAGLDADKCTAESGSENPDTACASLVDFVKLLINKHRIGMIGLMATSYCEIYRQARMIRKVVVTSAAPLEEQTKKRILSLVEKNLDGGTMDADFEVNPVLIGGFTVDIDNRRLDASVLNDLKQLRLSLLKS